MTNFLERADRLEDLIVKAINKSGKIVEVQYTNGITEKLTEFDAISRILNDSVRDQDPHIANVTIESDCSLGVFNNLPLALWASVQDSKQDEPTEPISETAKPGQYCFLDWYDRPVYAYWDGMYWIYEDKRYGADELPKILRPYHAGGFSVD